MLETIAISIIGAVSLLAAAFSILALKVADPLQARRMYADVSTFMTEVRNKLKDLEEVQLPHVESRAEAILERADLRFDGAESKRKSVAARDRHATERAAGSNGSGDWMDESLSRPERIAALDRAARG